MRGGKLYWDDVVKIKGSDKNYVYTINEREFPVSDGLTHLLIKSEPDPKWATDEELKTYKEMLMHTNAHKVGYRNNGKIQRLDESKKYKSIIKKIFPPRQILYTPILKNILTRRNTVADDRGVKLGRGVGYVKKRSQIFYKYWDDPNELVDRLRILIASQTTGHTGHENEIISIIEGLREAKIIK